MITYGFNVANTVRFSEEEAFALANDFTTLQLWYDRRGLSLHELDSVETVVDSRVNTILHVCVGVGEFAEVFTSVLPVLNALGHKELIVHPTRASQNAGTQHEILLAAAKYWIPILTDNGVVVYFENNSRLEPVLQTVEEIGSFFGTFPQTRFLLDVAHMDSYEHLQQLVKTKMPEMLHVADRHLDVVHEHLAVSSGNIDFSKVFGKYLVGFQGRIIFEVPWEPSARLSSKRAIERVVADCD